MSNKHQQLKLHQSFIFNPKHYRLFALGLFAFLCAYVVASTLTPVRESDASTVEITNNTTDYFIRITSADNLPMSVEASPTGQLALAADTLNIVTNSPNGYKLYVSTSGNDNNIYQNDSSSTASSGYFSPTTGTVSNPVNLVQNTWGFALSKVTDTSSSKYNPIASTFADISDYVNYTGSPTSNSTWASVPTFANSENAKISELSTSNSPDGNDLDIYYGVNASTTLPTGNYSTEVTYTAISEGVNVFPTMQDFTAEQCYNMAENTSINLSDARDDKYYRVTKMADGHCWMTDNLALDGTDKYGNVRILTPADSNVTTNRSLAANITDGTTSEYDVVQIYSGVANDVTDSCDLTANPYCIVNTTTKYGNLYNWNAATSGLGLQATTGTVTESICPKGWQLPDNSGVYSYQNLILHYGLPTEAATDGPAVQKTQQTPLYFALNGYYGGTGKYSQGILGHYWARQSADTTSAQYLWINTNTGQINPNYHTPKSNLISVRCVFSGQSTDPTMQDFTTTQCNNLATNASTVLVDRRNNQFYRVVHAQDGNCWMADDLNIYGQAISATDSDFTTPSTYTLPASITQTTEWNTVIMDRPMVEVSHGLGSNASTNPKSYGKAYYNWCAATVTSGESTISCSTTTTPNTSICPKGWQMPIYGDSTTNKSYTKLLNAYSITTTEAFFNNTILGFDKENHKNLYDAFSASEGYGNGPHFWQNTPANSDIAWNMRSADGIAGDPRPYNDSYKGGHGMIVRCVQR